MTDQIKNSFLQIKTEEKSSDGLFDYRFDDKELLNFYENKFYKIDNHFNFFENVIEVLWSRTETNLNIIRGKFIEEYTNNALANLETLFNAIEIKANRTLY